MRMQRGTTIAAIVLLALAAACASGGAIPPTTAPVTVTTRSPANALPTATTAPSATIPLTAEPSMATTAPTVAASLRTTAAPADSATPSVRSSTSTPAPRPIAHLAAGQAFTITSIDMLDAARGWAQGGPGEVGDHILTTADGGQTWKDVTPPEPASSSDPQLNHYAMGSFPDVHTGWVVYGTRPQVVTDTSTVWRTSDGGKTWAASQPIDIQSVGSVGYFYPSDLSFLPDNQTGWFLVHLGILMSHDFFNILRTTDGGQTWRQLLERRVDHGEQGCNKSGLQFTDLQNAWLTGDCAGVSSGVFFMSTTDGGATWKRISLPAPASRPDVFTRDDTDCGTYSLHIFAGHNIKMTVSCLNTSSNPFSYTYFIYTSTDGGQSWTSNPSPTSSLTFISPQIGWAQGAGGTDLQRTYTLSQTVDGGQTWTTLKQLTWSGELDFIDPQTGWAVANGNGAVSLVKTTDGGHRWQLVNKRIAP